MHVHVRSKQRRRLGRLLTRSNASSLGSSVLVPVLLGVTKDQGLERAKSHGNKSMETVAAFSLHPPSLSQHSSVYPAVVVESESAAAAVEEEEQ